LSDEPFGLKELRETYATLGTTGMIANLGTKLMEASAGGVVLEGHLTAEAHGFPTSRGPITHGGALATLADEALASAAYTLAAEGETTTTADLKVVFY